MWDEPEVYPFRRERRSDTQFIRETQKKGIGHIALAKSRDVWERTAKVANRVLSKAMVHREHSRGSHSFKKAVPRAGGRAGKGIGLEMAMERSSRGLITLGQAILSLMQQIWHWTRGTPGIWTSLNEQVLAVLRDRVGWFWWITIFLLARGTLLGGLAVGGPAALAVAAGRRPERLLWALSAALSGWASMWLPLWSSWSVIGHAPGSLPLGSWGDPMGLHPLSQLVAWLAVAAVSVGIAYRLRWSVPALAILTAVTLWMVEGFAVAWSKPSLYGGVIVAFEGLFAAVMVVTFATAEEALRGPSLRSFTREEKACLMALVLLALLGLPAERFLGITLTGVISRAGVLMGAYLTGPGGGAVFGVALGMLPSLASFGAPSSLALLAVSGLLAGVFRAWAKPGILGGFLLGHLILSIYMNNSNGVQQSLIEAGIAGAIFLLWPPSWLREAQRRLSSKAKPNTEELKRAVLRGRLNEMSQLFQQLATTFEDVAQPLPSDPTKMWDPLFHAIAGRVCRPCASYGLCWERDFHRTYQYLGELLTQIEEKGNVSAKDLTPQLARRCARLGELATTIACLLETVEVDRYWRRRLQESRGLVGSQFRGLSGWMSSLAREVEIEASPHKAVERVSQVLADKGFQLKSIRPKGTKDGWRILVEGRGCSGEWSCAELAAPAVAEVLGASLVVGKSRCNPKKAKRCAFSLAPVRPYLLQVGVAQVCRYGGAVSGDTVSQWEAPGAKAVIALSDGSGVGPRAARESSATLSLLEHFSRAGVGPGEAVRAVNSLVALATEEESFATVDMAVIDLSAAEMELIKLGAAPSYLKRGRRVQVLQRSSLPLGILKALEVESLVVSLLPGDRLVLISDGILDTRSREQNGVQEGDTEDWLAKFLEQVPADDPQALADLILSEAVQPNHQKARDDATVVVIGVMGRAEAIPAPKRLH